jgi:hypothetical protein
MTMNQQSCPKCQGEMEQGFVLDTTYGGRLVSHWSSGQPKESFWTGAANSPKKSRYPLARFDARIVVTWNLLRGPKLGPIEPGNIV